MGSKLAVVAIGGNAIAPDSNHLSFDKQYELVIMTAEHIADMIAEGWNVVLAHGNGPQVGTVLRQSELASPNAPKVPMDYAGAYTQGAIGYMFVNALTNIFKRRGINKNPVAVVTRTLVDAGDPSFNNPQKPVGDWYSQQEAKVLQEKQGWVLVEDSGRGYRRVVASPKPVRIVELESVKGMIDLGLTVIAVGGGGIPVISDSKGQLEGVEAVIDKDMSAAILAKELKADMLILPTAVERVAVRFGKPDQKWLDELSVSEAQGYLEDGEFPAGSMGPKVTALIDYVNFTGNIGVITTPEKMSLALKGLAGTRIVK